MKVYQVVLLNAPNVTAMFSTLAQAITSVKITYSHIEKGGGKLSHFTQEMETVDRRKYEQTGVFVTKSDGTSIVLAAIHTIDVFEESTHL